MLEVVLKEWQGSSQVSRIKYSLEAENIISYIRNRLEAAWLAQKVATGEQSQRPTTNIFLKVNPLWLYRPQLK